MAIRDKITAIDGRKLCFGERLHVPAKGGVLKPESKAGDGSSPSNSYEREYILRPEGKVLRGEWPDFDQANTSDLKNGMEVRLCGIETENAEGVKHAVPLVREVVIPGKASSRARSHELEDREKARSEKAKAARGAARATHPASVHSSPAPSHVKHSKADLDNMTVVELRELAAAEGVSLHGATSKDDIVHAIQRSK